MLQLLAECSGPGKGPSVRVVVLALGLVGGAVCVASDGQLPEQFRVWGRRAAPHAYLAEPGPRRPGRVEVRASAEETGRGFIVFRRPTMEVVGPDFVPDIPDRCEVLAARDCPGQYGPVTFFVFALRKGNFSVRVSDLASDAGRSIRAQNFDVRAVRYVRAGGAVFPLLLESFGSRDVPAGSTQQFWITYFVPPGTPPGTYEGEVRILRNGRLRLALPLRLRVNPFELVEPDVALYMYYSHSGDPAELLLIRKQYADQRCHGMNSGCVTPPVTRSGELSKEALGPFLDAYAEASFARREVRVSLWNRVTAEWLNAPDRSIGMYGPWFRYYPFSPELDERYVRTVRMIRDEARSRGLKLILAVADEPGSHPWTIPAARHYNELIRDALPDVVRELTVGGGWAMGQPEHELWKGLIDIWTTNRWLVDRLQAVRRDAPGAVIEIYNMAGRGSAPGGLQATRLFFGFFNWKAGVGGAAQWVYHHPATPEHNYTWPADDPSHGPVPTLRWEAAREGAKDRRYIATLEARLEGRTGPAAEAARAFLRELAGQVELRTGDYNPIDGGRVPAHPPGTYDAWRQGIADFIEQLGP